MGRGIHPTARLFDERKVSKVNEKMLDIYIKENYEMQLIGSAIKLVLRERKRQDAKRGSNRNLDDMTWLTILTEEVGESAEAILKNLPEKVDEVVQITAVALAWLECILRTAELRNEAVDVGADESIKQVRTED